MTSSEIERLRVFLKKKDTAACTGGYATICCYPNKGPAFASPKVGSLRVDGSDVVAENLRIPGRNDKSGFGIRTSKTICD